MPYTRDDGLMTCRTPFPVDGWGWGGLLSPNNENSSGLFLVPLWLGAQQVA